MQLELQRRSSGVYQGLPVAVPVSTELSSLAQGNSSCQWVPSAPSPPQLRVTGAPSGRLTVELEGGGDWLGVLLGVVSLVTGVAFSILVLGVSSNIDMPPAMVVFFICFMVAWFSVGIKQLRESLVPEHHIFVLDRKALRYTRASNGCSGAETDCRFIRSLVTDITEVVPRSIDSNSDRAAICIKSSDGASCAVDLPTRSAQHWLLTLLQNWHNSASDEA